VTLYWNVIGALSDGAIGVHNGALGGGGVLRGRRVWVPGERGWRGRELMEKYENVLSPKKKI